MEDWVPKVHPVTRSVEPEDPMEIVPTVVQGDPEVMLESIIQEYAWMGWDADQLMGLFRSPFYPLLHQLREHYGEEHIRQRVEGVLGRSGELFSVRAIIAEDPEPEEDDEAELIEVSVSRIVREQ